MYSVQQLKQENKKRSGLEAAYSSSQTLNMGSSAFNNITNRQSYAVLCHYLDILMGPDTPYEQLISSCNPWFAWV